MSRGRKTVPEGKGPVPQGKQEAVDMSVVMEMLHKLNSRMDEMKKKSEEQAGRGIPN